MPEHLLLETRDRVGLIRINRPQRMNALNNELAREICEALFAYDADPAIGCSIITGNEKAFAAGADIGAMADWHYAKVYAEDYITADWEGIRRVRKPIIAAVAGYALGGGCELAMACDMIIAADTAKFGQPEITIGTMPGFGGTQRLPRLVGPAKALEMNTIGDAISADEAFEYGLVNRVVADHELFDTALAWGRKYAGQAPVALQQIKQVSHAGDLDEGLAAERDAFLKAFTSEDAREGIAAFIEKRKAKFTGR
jgi:enoyl-CoA hydratase/carnithine racemase